jgi:hypothetical protein
MKTETLGQAVHSYFLDYLIVQRGLRPATIRSYRDVLKLFLAFVAEGAIHFVVRRILRLLPTLLLLLAAACLLNAFCRGLSDSSKWEEWTYCGAWPHFLRHCLGTVLGYGVLFPSRPRAAGGKRVGPLVRLPRSRCRPGRGRRGGSQPRELFL